MLDDLTLAQGAALAGARLGLAYFERVQRLPQALKADGSIVTEADLAVESVIRDTLARSAPFDDAFLGEETGSRGAGRRRWILDGIDGTLVFVQGDNRWQSLIALEEAGEITLGVVVVPAQRTLWWAVRGQGAFVAPIVDDQLGPARRLRVTAPPVSLSECRLGILPPIDLLPAPLRPIVEPLAVATRPIPWSIHGALLVAAGTLDLAVQVGGKVWDYAPLGLIVQEAGGTFGAPTGQGHPLVGTALFAASDALHQSAHERLTA